MIHRSPMRIEKKLKQGLVDLSGLFSAHYGFSLGKEGKAPLTIEPPIEVPLDGGPPRLITAAFSVSHHDAREDFDFMRLTKSLERAFEKIFILSLASSQSSDKGLPVMNGKQAEGKTSVPFYPIGKKISLAVISMSQMKNLLEPEVASSHQPHDFSDSKKALVIWNLVSTNLSLRESLFLGCSVVEVVDHYVLIAQV